VILLAAGELAGCDLRAGPADALVTGVVADSRDARPGSLFVALPGTRTDGHDFVQHARSLGAVAALCAAGRSPDVEGLAVLEAPDPLKALGAIGAQVRARSRCSVVGVAGAAGKTTTKDVLASLCAPHASLVASRRSYNNELGVPLTLCRIEPSTEIAVCELGTGAPGELAALCGLARPDAGVLTSLGAEHLELLGTVEAAAREEAALLAALPRGAPTVLPFDEPLLAPHRRGDLAEVGFGADPRADVHVVSWAPAASGTRVELDVRGARTSFRTSLRGAPQRLALCAAVAAYAALGLPLDRVGEGAEQIELSPWRGQERGRTGGGILINDAYNANPVSMRAALTSLMERRPAQPGRVVAVLGEMAELGPDADDWHRRVGELASGVDLLVGIGPLARHYCRGAGAGVEARWFPDREAAARDLPALVDAGDVILLKGSRCAGLERLERALSGARRPR
jgi:UDP-N-acetylmuramoyl-tripeptide--D-alanyl-D-alanine ligase